MTGRLLSDSLTEPNRPSHHFRLSAKARCSAPGRLVPTSSRRSRWRATKLMIGTGRAALAASTSLATLGASSATH